MREELNFDDMDMVTGGRYIINGNQHKIAFRDVQRVFKLSPDCNDYEVMAACDSLIGKYATEQEYDNACIALLQSKGWI